MLESSPPQADVENRGFSKPKGWKRNCVHVKFLYGPPPKLKSTAHCLGGAFYHAPLSSCERVIITRLSRGESRFSKPRLRDTWYDGTETVFTANSFLVHNLQRIKYYSIITYSADDGVDLVFRDDMIDVICTSAVHAQWPSLLWGDTRNVWKDDFRGAPHSPCRKYFPAGFFIGKDIW